MAITFIGMPGVGKSAVGEALANKLSYQFIDTDDLLTQGNKERLESLLHFHGDEGFKKREAALIKDIPIRNDMILSPGGSVVYNKDGVMDYLKEHSFVIHLDALFPVIKYRINGNPLRGIVGLNGGTLKDLYDVRMPLYKKYADASVMVREDLTTTVGLVRALYEMEQSRKRN